MRIGKRENRALLQRKYQNRIITIRVIWLLVKYAFGRIRKTVADVKYFCAFFYLPTTVYAGRCYAMTGSDSASFEDSSSSSVCRRSLWVWLNEMLRHCLHWKICCNVFFVVVVCLRCHFAVGKVIREEDVVRL